MGQIFFYPIFNRYVYIFLFVVGLIIGASALYIYFRPKVKQIQINNEEKIKELNSLNDEILIAITKQNDLKQALDILEEQAQQASEKFLEQYQSQAELKFEIASEKMAKQYQDYEEECKKEYLSVVEDMAKAVNIQISSKQKELSELEDTLNKKRSYVAAAIAADKRALEMTDKINFYKINISETDLIEIQKLKEVSKILRDSEPINKVIWKVYYEKPCNDMIGRILGNQKRSGIYKITNIENKMCYVGQSVDIAERFRQHIKRGLGAETPTKNKLYPAMASFGVENFTFEIIEECEKSQLNDKEDYWQNYFEAKEFGYSIK